MGTRTGARHSPTLSELAGCRALSREDEESTRRSPHLPGEAPFAAGHAQGFATRCQSRLGSRPCFSHRCPGPAQDGGLPPSLGLYLLPCLGGVPTRQGPGPGAAGRGAGLGERGGSCSTPSCGFWWGHGGNRWREVFVTLQTKVVKQSPQGTMGTTAKAPKIKLTSALVGGHSGTHP